MLVEEAELHSRLDMRGKSIWLCKIKMVPGL